MAKKKPAKKNRTINQRFTALERLVRTGFQQTKARFRQVDRRLGLVQFDIHNLRKEMNERFAVMEDRIDRLATHVDGFMKLHETGAYCLVVRLG
jgi:hypothetical protein